jgi:hypothetical protein
MANKESKALQHITKKKIPLLFLHKSLIFLTPFLILSFCFAWEIRSNPSQWWLTPDSSKMSFWFGTNPFIFKEQIIVLNALQYQLPLNSSFVKDRITDQINVFLWKHFEVSVIWYVLTRYSIRFKTSKAVHNHLTLRCRNPLTEVQSSKNFISVL